MGTETVQSSGTRAGLEGSVQNLLSRGAYVFWIFIRAFIRDRKSHILTLLGLLPVPVLILSGQVPAEAYPARTFFIDLTQSMYISLLIPLFGLLLGTAALTDEIESHTIVQLVSRPVRRMEILVWRYIATVLAGTIVAIVVTSGFYLTLNLYAPIPLELLTGFWGVCAICNAVYCALFILLGVALKRPLIWGVVITLYEQLLGVLAVFIGGAAFSVSGHILHVGTQLVDYSYSIVDWTPTSSGILLVAITLMSILLSTLLFRRKDLS
ncbi:MAG: ABC transporter permease subunit [Candidatus Thorarchaeota archaeon]